MLQRGREVHSYGYYICQLMIAEINWNLQCRHSNKVALVQNIKEDQVPEKGTCLGSFGGKETKY